MDSLPTFASVKEAAAVIKGHAHRTPVLTSRTANQISGAELYFKCENLQRMGAFKFRGAFNALSRFGPRQKEAGVVAFSSGNHAQAIALSARILGMPATIVMPNDAPAAKVAATREYGGTVVSYDRYREDREAIGADLASRHGMTLIPPYDHADIIAGQGTAALELLEDVGASMRCSSVLGAEGCFPGVPSRRAPWRLRSGSLALSPRPAMTASSPCARARSLPSIRQRRLPMARRPSILGN